MKYKPIKDFVHVQFLKENFEEKKTESGIIVKNSGGKDLANKFYLAEVIETGPKVKEVEKGDIVYFINYKPISMSHEGDYVARNLIITKEGNIMLKRKKEKGDELIEQSFS